ncbi:MAG: hypothetical protein AMJ53_11305 [Gammaproteobacteria bacterium SG8_11]|nr:MAG: hypothetical protein AMJ53_11305 [Gammaproteobacteria bacterium SG8_11]
MSVEKNSLNVPPVAFEDDGSVEILRLWVANESLQACLNPQVFGESAPWGIALADAARHVANAMHETTGKPIEQSILEIRDLFNAELDSPTDQPTGSFVS